MECEYCKTSFANTQNLLNHKKTAKYCLVLQGNSKIVSYDCFICKRQFTSNKNRNVHETTCFTMYNVKEMQRKYVETIDSLETKLNDELKLVKELEDENFKYRYENENLKEKIHDLEKQFLRKETEIYKSVSRSPSKISTKNNNSHNKTNNTNNNTNNITNNITILTPMEFDKEEYEAILRKVIKEDSFAKIPDDVIDLIIKEILVDSSGQLKYVCTDRKNRKCNWVNKKGEKCIDKDTEKILTIADSIQYIIEDVKDKHENQEGYDRKKHGRTTAFIRSALHYLKEYLDEPESFSDAICDKLTEYKTTSQKLIKTDDDAFDAIKHKEEEYKIRESTKTKRELEKKHKLEIEKKEKEEALKKIKIVNFGRESLGHLSTKVNLYEPTSSPLTDLINNLHFNEDIPEYRNVKFDSGSETASIFKNGKWTTEEKYSVLKQLTDQALSLLKTICDTKEETNSSLPKNEIDEDSVTMIEECRYRLESYHESKNAFDIIFKTIKHNTNY